MRREPEALPLRQPLLFQPFERRTPFSFGALVDETRAIWFPELECEIETRIVALSSLASVWYHRMGIDRHVVVFHPLLNRPDIPLEVVRLIAKHELTHIRLPGQGHSPEFWKTELAAGPERFAVWAWLHCNLYPPLRATRWGTNVIWRWQRSQPRTVGPYTPHLPFDDPPWHVLCPEGGAQLRLVPFTVPG
jgi:hypothetical protein